MVLSYSKIQTPNDFFLSNPEAGRTVQMLRPNICSIRLVIKRVSDFIPAIHEIHGNKSCYL